MTATMPGPDAATTDIAAGDLRRLLADGGACRLLDVRTPGEFAAGHIPGAVNIPLDQLRDVADDLTDPHANTLVLICQSGGRANSARGLLAGAGAANVVVLQGGMNSWAASGGQTRNREGRWTLERQVRFVAGLLVLTAILISITWPPARYFAGLIGAGLVFAAVTNTCAMGLLLARLPYNRGRSCDIDSALSDLTR